MIDYNQMLSKYFNFRNGFFVEAGANNGIDQSNTIQLENNFGWSGLLIEPNTFKFNQCISNRPKSICENYALVSDSYDSDTIDGDFSHNDDQSLMSLVSDPGDFFDDELLFYKEQRKRDCKIISVPVSTMNALLEKHKINNIDFFSLDVEGYEISVLNGLNFDKFRPKYFLIETCPNLNGGNRLKAVTDYMSSKKYEAVENVSRNDTIYKDIL